MADKPIELRCESVVDDPHSYTARVITLTRLEGDSMGYPVVIRTFDPRLVPLFQVGTVYSLVLTKIR